MRSVPDDSSKVLAIALRQEYQCESTSAFVWNVCPQIVLMVVDDSGLHAPERVRRCHLSG